MLPDRCLAEKRQSMHCTLIKIEKVTFLQTKAKDLERISLPESFFMRQKSLKISIQTSLNKKKTFFLVSSSSS